MRYFPMRLLAEIKADTDILGNPVMELEESDRCYRGRFTVWTADEVRLTGREVTQTQQKIVTDAPLAMCRRAAGVRTVPEDYRILSVSDLNGRWRLLTVERWRSKCGSD